MTSDDAASPLVLRAREAREAGQLWQARDLLAAHVEEVADPQACAELGEVLHQMGDLPRAGAAWFAAGARGPEVDEAVAAWREQSHDDFGVMWRSLPASARAEPRPRRIEALRERALQAGADVADTTPDAVREPGTTPEQAGAPAGEVEEPESGIDANWVVAWLLAAAFVVLAVIGFVTVLGWLVPG